MSRKTPWSHAVAAILTFLLINLFIIMAMVISPSHSRVSEVARAYKLVNLSIGAVIFIVAIWRDLYVHLTIFAFLQVIAFFIFAEYLNGLPD